MEASYVGVPTPYASLICLSPDCQQQAGLSAWVPFHESASAVTQLYKGSTCTVQ